MNRRLSLLFVFIIILTLIIIPVNAQEQEPIKIYTNGELLEFDVPPVIVNGRTLVPLRDIFEALGVEPTWNGETRTVTADKGLITIILPIDSKYATVNGVEIELDVPATIVDGRTLVPVRFIAESLGANVIWDNETRTIEIESTDEQTNQFVINSFKKLEDSILESVREFSEEYFKELELIYLEELSKYNLGGKIPEEFSIEKYEKLEKQLIQEYKPYVFENGDKYIGEWKEDKMTGKGVYYWVEGDKYIGDFKNGKRTGKGMYCWSDSTIYVGDFINGKVNGEGIYYWTDGDVYIGDLKDGELTGKGMFYWLDGHKYIGDFVNGERTGKGVFYWIDGDKYIGDFKDGELTGKGILYWVEGDKYIGDFINSKVDGEGVYYWIDGDKYIGNFKDGQRTGKGVLYWANGDKYIGDFKDGQRIGKGAYYWADGLRYFGEFKDGERTVNGIYVDNNNVLNLREKCQQIINMVIKPNMTDLEKERALYDYIITNTKYDIKNYRKNIIPSESHTAYGVLEKRIAVCDGYAEAMKMLFDLIGIECVIVHGEARGGSDEEWEGHAWNIVNIDGVYYHLDATFDDPVPDRKRVRRYKYFNLTDDQIAKDHRWDTEKYPKCNNSD